MSDPIFLEAVERYKAALLQTAREGGNVPGTPVEAEGAAETVREAEETGDALQTFPPPSDSFEDFSTVNTEIGFLRVQSFAGQQTAPVSGARVLITHTFRDGARRFGAGETDESGVLDSIALPAPPAALSQTPSGRMPYALYDVRVTHPDFRVEFFRNVPVFAGVKSIQPVRFLADRTGP